MENGIDWQFVVLRFRVSARRSIWLSGSGSESQEVALGGAFWRVQIIEQVISWEWIICGLAMKLRGSSCSSSLGFYLNSTNTDAD